MVAELKQHVTNNGWSILQGSCFEPDQALPYVPVIDLLHALCATRSEADLRQAFAPHAAQLRALLPELTILSGTCLGRSQPRHSGACSTR